MAVAKNISDIIVPIIIASKEENGFHYETLLGTGFYIGKSGYLLTAGHVLDQSRSYTTSGKALGVILIINGQRKFFESLGFEKHPTQPDEIQASMPARSTLPTALLQPL